MTEPEYETMAAGLPDCPSDLDLDALFMREIKGAPAAAIRAHVKDCTVCPARMRAREEGFDFLSEPDPRRMMANVLRRVEEEEAKQLSARARRLWWSLFGTLALATTAVVLYLNRPIEPTHGLAGPAVRTKGDFTLEVHRQVGDTSQAIAPDDRVAAGEPLRFVISLPEAGFVRIIGREASGALYPAFPADTAASERLPAGGPQVLPTAFSLDESPGPERFHLVLCPAPTAGPCAAGEGDQLTCPDGCRVTALTIRKAP